MGELKSHCFLVRVGPDLLGIWMCRTRGEHAVWMHPHVI